MNLEVYTSSYKNPFEKDNSIRSKILTGAGLAIAACAQYYLGTIYKQ